jgi:hypothetical protein
MGCKAEEGNIGYNKGIRGATWRVLIRSLTVGYARVRRGSVLGTGKMGAEKA